MKCGLLGRKLVHSYSPQIHNALGGYSYVLFEKEPDALEEFLKHGDFDGINVTIPYKKDVIPYLDELSPRAKELGAVNTIVRRNGKLIGHNTDYFGFSAMVARTGLELAGKKALVLGSGGASNTAAAVLKGLGAQVVVISRSGENNYNNLSRHADAAVIVNTTPVGMFPNVDASPIGLDGFPKLEGVLDVIYNPARTKLLLDAEKRGLITSNGLYMLVAQAKESAQWYLEKEIPDAVIGRIHAALRCQMENLILVGMPGCGKSTVGQLVAQRLGKPFVDADAVLEADAGEKITTILPRDGEAAFRLLETKALEKLGARSGLVIATGGGCVTQERNYPLLHRNGSIFYVTRELEQLAIQGRPLSGKEKLEGMYAARHPLYEQFADFTVSNSETPQAAAEKIIALWEKCL